MREGALYMNTKTDIPNLTDKDYFSLSQNTYSEKKMRKAYENKTPLVNDSKKLFM